MMMARCQMSIETTTCEAQGYSHPSKPSALQRFRPKHEVTSHVVQSMRFEQQLENSHET